RVDPAEPSAAALQQQEGPPGPPLYGRPGEVPAGRPRAAEVLPHVPGRVHLRGAVRDGRRRGEAGREQGEAALEGLGLRRQTGGGPRSDRHPAHPRRRAGEPRADDPGRLQRGPASDGLVHGRRSPSQEGSAGPGRLERPLHVVDRVGRHQPRRARRNLRRRFQRLVRLARERAHRRAEDPVGARDGQGGAEADRRGDPEGRPRRGDVRAVRPVGLTHRVSQEHARLPAVPGAGLLERLHRVIGQIGRRLMATIPVMGVVAIAVFALLPVFVVAISMHWPPVQGYRPLADGVWPFLRHLILPAVTLSVVYMALIARMTRASMLGVLSEDFIRTAFAKGLAPRRVLIHHALKNASLPVVTIIGIGFALLIGGAVVTESVFALPGLGRLTVDAIIRRDYPVIQGVILVVSGVYVLINLVVDVLYVVLDPRIRY